MPPLPHRSNSNGAISPLAKAVSVGCFSLIASVGLALIGMTLVQLVILTAAALQKLPIYYTDKSALMLCTRLGWSGWFHTVPVDSLGPTHGLMNSAAFGAFWTILPVAGGVMMWLWPLIVVWAVASSDKHGCLLGVIYLVAWPIFILGYATSCSLGVLIHWFLVLLDHRESPTALVGFLIGPAIPSVVFTWLCDLIACLLPLLVVFGGMGGGTAVGSAIVAVGSGIGGLSTGGASAQRPASKRRVYHSDSRGAYTGHSEASPYVEGQVDHFDPSGRLTGHSRKSPYVEGQVDHIDPDGAPVGKTKR